MNEERPRSRLPAPKRKPSVPAAAAPQGDPSAPMGLPLSFFATESESIVESLPVDSRAEASVLVAGIDRPPGEKAFGRYLDPAVLAQGGMGAILTAFDDDLGRPVAIKVILSGRLAGRREVARFIREARITGQLQHPNIPPVYEIGRLPQGDIYFTMKLIQGTTLARAIRDGARDTRQFLGDFLKVCDALAYAHSRDVIHRDLKPANVMLGEFGEVLVMDWGLAKVRGQVASDGEEGGAGAPPRPQAQLTATGAVLGTPAYMSPEQAEGNLARIDERTDVYGLGAILYEIVTERPPYEKLSWPQIAVAMSKGGPPRPIDRAPELRIDKELDAIVTTAMSIDRALRYPTVQTLKRDVESYLAGHPVSALSYAPPARLVKWTRRNLVRAVPWAMVVLETLLIAWMLAA